MKKYLAVVAVAVLVAFAAPAFAATNPFMDVPINHWSYDAIGQLAAQGVLSGYPDGTYKGKQPTTRYEMASALARALAVVDLTKASKQDVEMLKKLVVEFKDELDALGVRVDQIDARLGKIEDRLGGWKISGVLRQDFTNYDGSDDDTVGSAGIRRARLTVERWFGEDESSHFVARLRGENGRYSDARTDVYFDRYYVETPFFFDSTLIVGRHFFDPEAEYYIDGGPISFSKHMGYGTDSVLFDRTVDKFGFVKPLGIGQVYLYAGHPSVAGFNAWEITGGGAFEFNEQFGLDLGINAYFGDDGSEQEAWYGLADVELDHLYTIYAGLRFKFNESIALKGIFYYQDLDGSVGGVDWDLDSTNAFKIFVHAKQDLLKFTSLILQYDYYDTGFIVPSGTPGIFNAYDDAAQLLTSLVDVVKDSGVFPTTYADAAEALSLIVPDDLTVWRIAAQQEWTDKWTTFLYYANYNFDSIDADIKQYGLGVTYQLNPAVILGLAYNKFDLDDFGVNDQSTIRFRTQVSF